MNVVCVAPNPGPIGLPVVFGIHEFGPTKDKQLGHWIDGQLRATIPPEGFDDYAKAWPQCADVVKSLKLAPKAATGLAAAAGAVEQVRTALQL